MTGETTELTDLLDDGALVAQCLRPEPDLTVDELAERFAHAARVLLGGAREHRNLGMWLLGFLYDHAQRHPAFAGAVGGRSTRQIGRKLGINYMMVARGATIFRAYSVQEMLFHTDLRTQVFSELAALPPKVRENALAGSAARARRAGSPLMQARRCLKLLHESDARDADPARPTAERDEEIT